MRRVFCFTLGFIVSSSTVAAQASCTSGTGANFGARASCTDPGTTVTGTMNVVRVGRITLSSASTSITPSGLDYENAETGLGSFFGGPTFTVQSNNTYNVSIQYGATFTSPGSKPVQEVAIQAANAGSCNPTGNDAGYAPLSAGGGTTTIESGASSTASRVRQLCIKVKWLWTVDTPGNYSLPLSFRITAP